MPFLTALTAVSGNLHKVIWLILYEFLGQPAFTIVAITLALVLPIHGVITALTEKESELLRALSGISFSISIFLLGTLIALSL